MLHVNSKFSHGGKIFRPGDVVGAEELGDELARFVDIGYIYGIADDMTAKSEVTAVKPKAKSRTKK